MKAKNSKAEPLAVLNPPVAAPDAPGTVVTLLVGAIAAGLVIANFILRKIRAAAIGFNYWSNSFMDRYLYPFFTHWILGTAAVWFADVRNLPPQTFQFGEKSSDVPAQNQKQRR